VVDECNEKIRFVWNGFHDLDVVVIRLKFPTKCNVSEPAGAELQLTALAVVLGSPHVKKAADKLDGVIDMRSAHARRLGHGGVEPELALEIDVASVTKPDAGSRGMQTVTVNAPVQTWIQAVDAGLENREQIAIPIGRRMIFGECPHHGVNLFARAAQELTGIQVVAGILGPGATVDNVFRRRPVRR
jgi:hypothetical protein